MWSVKYSGWDRSLVRSGLQFIDRVQRIGWSGEIGDIVDCFVQQSHFGAQCSDFCCSERSDCLSSLHQTVVDEVPVSAHLLILQVNLNATKLISSAYPGA